MEDVSLDWRTEMSERWWTLVAASLVGMPIVAGGETVPAGPEFQVNTYTTGNQEPYLRSICRADAGDFVIVWDSPQDGSQRGIFARRYDRSAVPQGAEFQVNGYTTGTQRGPSVAC